jgi:hypothetical protein
MKKYPAVMTEKEKKIVHKVIKTIPRLKYVLHVTNLIILWSERALSNQSCS